MRVIVSIGLIVAFVTIGLSGWPAAFAQGTSADQPSLAGIWLVTVSGEANTRTLIVPEAAPAESGQLVGAQYGLSGGKLPPVDARLIVATTPRQLRVLTQASSLIEVTEQADGSFKGTFTSKGGSVREARIARVTDGKLPQALPAKDTSAFFAPDPAVPKACAAFHGNWAGTWSTAGAGSSYLRVVEASYGGGRCRLRFSYSSSKGPVPATLGAEFEGSNFSFVCNRSTQGTCVFRLASDELWASYTNPAGGSNTAVFKRVQE